MFFSARELQAPCSPPVVVVILSQSTCDDHLIKGSLATAAYAIYSFGD